MGRRGPAPIPTRLKILAGNPSHRPLNKHEPQPAAGRLACPQWLTGEGRRCWREVLRVLGPTAVLTAADRQAVAVYAALWADWRELRDFLALHGRTYPVRGDDGDVRTWVARPEVLLFQKVTLQVLRYQQELGLTPSARSRMSVATPAKKADALEEFLRPHDRSRTG